MNRKNIYAVPDLPIKEIISYFEEMDVKIAASDIFKPTTPFVQKLYETILDLFEGPSQSIMDESLLVIRQVQRMGSFLERIGFQGFTIRDLCPDSKRLIEILSPIINFGMYRDNKRSVYEKVSQMADNNFKIKKEQERVISTIKSEIEKAQVDLEDNLKKQESIESEISTLESELKSFIKYQKDKISEVNLLKSEKTELEDRLASSQLLVHNLKQEITCLKSQIVSDPTKLMELVEEMKQLIENEKESMKNTEKSISEGNAKLARVSKASESILRLQVVVKELTDLDEKMGEMDQKSVILESKVKNWDSSINALKIRINHIDRQISHLESKILNLQNKDKKCSDEISSKISNLKIRYDSMNGEREKMMVKVRSNNKMVQDIMYEMAKMGGEFENDCSDIAGLLVQLNGRIDQCFSEVNTMIEN